jgi:endonuclease/exonuclease/phosphatase family metal-dependent hydrolase
MRSTLPALLLLALGCAAPRAGTVAAPAWGELRVLVLNMHAGKDAAGQDNLARVAELVEETRADLVLLQEVDSLTRRSGAVDQPAALARLTGFHARFGNALAYQGGGYGIATLSRFPVRASRLVRLPVDPPQERAGGSREPRGVLHVVVETPAGPLHVLNTHLDPSGDDRWRRQEGDSVLAVARALAGDGLPVLAGGDFNATPESAAQRALRAGGLRDLWPGCGAGDGLTYPASGPTKRIDYLFALGDVTCSGARVLRSEASDHLGVLFVLRVR